MVISTVTREQRDILAHSLGIVHYAQESYRNHFHSDPGPDLETLVSAGYMTRRAAGAGAAILASFNRKVREVAYAF